MLDTNEAIYRQYETLGISKEVLDFGTSVEKELKERFDKIDTNACLLYTSDAADEL